MGCDIHIRAQKQCPDGSWQDLDFRPFDWRSYGMFGFLADVRNYSKVPPISEARGLPQDMTNESQNCEPWDDTWRSDLGEHSFSWLSVKELVDFNYDQQFEDRRVGRQEKGYWNGAALAEPGGGQIVTFREFLGPAFFDDLAKLKELGADRIVFGFDS